MARAQLLTGFVLFIWITSYSQEPIKHEKKIYTSPDNKIFINKALPIYFKVSTSPEANAPSYLMPSSETPKYANPMYLDTEGQNTLRSPSAVDPATKEVVMPKQDVRFEVFADGVAPTTKIHITEVEKHLKNKAVYFGKGLKISLSSSDEVSGVETTYLSVNQSAYQDYAKSQGTFDEEKEYLVSYYSVDHVGNDETPKTEKFKTDYTAPVTTIKILGESKGKVLSSKASISLTSIDTLSGVKHIMYSINEGADKAYTAPIPLSVLKDGVSKINYYAIDNVGNKEEKKVISTSTDALLGNGNESSTFSFYIDKEAPTMSFEIVGDQYKGKNFYMSERSRFNIVATDEKSGVAQITYGVNSPTLKETFSEPFGLKTEGLNTIAFASADNVGNIALSQTHKVYLDKSLPHSKLSYNGKHFLNRDSNFITKETRITLTASETGSGLQSISYMLDNGNKTAYESPIAVEAEGVHTLDYFATDNVNNTEAVKKCFFIVDNSAPKILCNFSVKAIGEKTVRENKYTIYPSNVIVYIAATDNTSGVERLEYQINGKEAQTITPIKALVPGNYEIQITVYDALKNKASDTIRFAVEN